MAITEKKDNDIRRIIFLDIDGVLAGIDFLCTGKGFIDKSKVLLLNQLRGCEVVISSSWGEDADKPLKDLGLELPIIGHTQHLSLRYEYMCRGNEIEKWLRDNFPRIMGTKFGSHYDVDKYRYVILDDDTDFLLGQNQNFIKTNEHTGLLESDIDKAKKILGIDE